MSEHAHINISLQTTSWRHDPDNPTEIGFLVQCDIMCEHPRFKEILAMLVDNKSPTIDDAIRVLEALK